MCAKCWKYIFSQLRWLVYFLKIYLLRKHRKGKILNIVMLTLFRKVKNGLQKAYHLISLEGYFINFEHNNFKSVYYAIVKWIIKFQNMKFTEKVFKFIIDTHMLCSQAFVKSRQYLLHVWSEVFYLYCYTST